MHHALEIPEIVLAITELLDKPDTLHIGQTCKELWSIVVGEVWREVDFHAFGPLLPSDLHVLPASATGERLSRPLRDEDCRRLLEYGGNVRSLVSAPTDSEIFHVLSAAVAYAGAKVVFPRLTSVSFWFDSVRQIVASRPFLIATLEDLALEIDFRCSCPASLVVVRSMIDTIGTFNPGIQNLLLMFHEGPPGWSTEILQPINSMFVRLPRLQNVCLHDLTDAYWLLPCLATMPRLTNLEFGFFRGAELPRLVLPSGAFPTLQHLEVSSHLEFALLRRPPLPKSPLADFLRSVSSRSLATLRIVCEDDTASGEVLKLVADKWSSTITSLSLTLEMDDVCADEVTVTNLVPLYVCSKLQALVIKTYGPINFTDNDYNIMSASWPKLRVLSIIDTWHIYWMGRDVPWTPKNTYRSLVLLSARCPSLEQLHVSADFTRDFEPFNLPETPLATTLEDFTLSPSAVYDCTEDVTQFLLTVFPKVRTEVIFYQTKSDTESDPESDTESDEELDGSGNEDALVAELAEEVDEEENTAGSEQ